MKVHLIKEKTIRDYVPANAGSSIPFIEWLSKAKKADWESPQILKKHFLQQIYWVRAAQGLYLI